MATIESHPVDLQVLDAAILCAAGCPSKTTPISLYHSRKHYAETKTTVSIS